LINILLVVKILLNFFNDKSTLGSEGNFKSTLKFSNIDINLIAGGNGTALHCACKKNNLKVVSLLLLHKADYT